MFKLNSCYKGTNSDGSYVIFKVEKISNRYSPSHLSLGLAVRNMVNIKIIIDYDCQSWKFQPDDTLWIDTNDTQIWYSNAVEIKTNAELLALIL